MACVHHPHPGCPNFFDIVRELEAHGGSATHVRKTGEIRLRHPLLPYTVKVNGRRKDASRAALRFLRHVRRRLAERANASSH